MALLDGLVKVLPTIFGGRHVREALLELTGPDN